VTQQRGKQERKKLIKIEDCDEKEQLSELDGLI
jgi:hypothetical protein